MTIVRERYEAEPGVGPRNVAATARLGGNYAGPQPRSVRRHGTCFFMRAIPAECAMDLYTMVSPESAPPTDVLFVDDDPDLRKAVHLMLDLAGYEVRCAENGKTALEAVAEKMPAVVLLDMLMPIMNGWECAAELRARFGRNVPIVVVTAAEHAQARAAQIGGVADVLQKPFDMDDLLLVVARYVPGKASMER